MSNPCDVAVVGAPTDDLFLAPSLLVGFPFLN